MKKKPKITLEGLARLVERGFTAMGKRFDTMENRLDRYATATHGEITDLREVMNVRFDKVDTRLESIDGDISEIKGTLDRHDTRVAGVEGIIISRNNSAKSH